MIGPFQQQQRLLGRFRFGAVQTRQGDTSRITDRLRQFQISPQPRRRLTEITVVERGQTSTFYCRGSQLDAARGLRELDRRGAGVDGVAEPAEEVET